jgi:ribose transport system substrate-binding protein
LTTTLTNRQPGGGRRRWRLGAAVTAAGAAMLIAACSSGSSSSASSSGPGAPASSPAAGGTTTAATALAATENYLKPYTTGAVTWSGPTSSPPIAPGKHIVWLNIAPTDQNIQLISAAATQVAQVLGWTVTKIDASSQSFQQAVTQAISLHPDGIIWNYDDASEDPAALAQIAAAKIPTIVFGVGDVPANYDNPAITHIVSLSYTEQGELVAAAAAQAAGGDAHLGILNLPGTTALEQTDQGIDSYFSAHGGGSVTATENLDESIIFNPAAIGQAAVAFIQAHPDLTSIFLPFDGTAVEVVPALRQAGLTSKVKVISVEGDPVNFALIREGAGQIADVAYPAAWATWAAFDDFNRIFNHVALPAQDGIPLRLIQQGNVPAAGQPWSGDFDFRAKYEALWGKS